MSPSNDALSDAGPAVEIYADGAASVSVRRGVARIVLFSERAGADGSKVFTRTAAGHIAMPLSGLLGLYARMQNVIDQMRASGALPAGANSKPAEASSIAPTSVAWVRTSPRTSSPMWSIIRPSASRSSV